VILAINTGMRRGQILSLRWSKVDYASDPCCGVVAYAWLEVLVPKRQAPAAP
jgi:integrase